MKGQWVGSYMGTNNGQIVVNLDELENHFEGVAYLFDSQMDLPATVATIKTPNKASKFDLAIPLAPVDNSTGNLLNPEEFVARYPNVILPTSASTHWEKTTNGLNVSWQTNIGTSGTTYLPQSHSDKPSELNAIQLNSWSQFRDWADTQSPYKLVFRGQSDSNWRLRTSFHRNGRFNLQKFKALDIPSLHNQLSNLTLHPFDLAKPIDYGAFVALAQHHGYPTPLLDWTYSPFVAAYFAYCDVVQAKSTEGQKIRIFAFDAVKWSSDLEQLRIIDSSKLHFSMIEALALNNPRMVPQQALASVTNVDDIESYVRNREQLNSKTYLQAIDLPATSRNEAIKNLNMMGITAGSLFPGIDGVCKQLKERYFNF